MIRKVTFENFFSLREKGHFDLTTSAKTPTDLSFTPSYYGDQVSILGGIFGPNASGKTNLLKVFSFLNFFLNSSYQNLKVKQEIPVDGFSTSEEPISFTLEFENKGSIFRYYLQLTSSEVIQERLRRFHKKTNSFRTILRRKATPKGASFTQTDNFTDIKTLSELLKNRPNASMISAGLVTGRPEFEVIANALGDYESNVHRTGKQDVHASNQVSQLISCARYFQDNEHFQEEVEARPRRLPFRLWATKLQRVNS